VGINSAVEIMTSGEAAATWGKATTTLLQSTQVGSSAHAKKHAAFRSVMIAARRYPGLRLATLAAALIQTATEGNFSAVITTIDKQLGDLHAEEQKDIDLKVYCKTEGDKTANEMDDLHHKMTKIQGLMDPVNLKEDRAAGRHRINRKRYHRNCGGDGRSALNARH